MKKTIKFDEQFRYEYPLRVRWPHMFGPRYVLLWWTHEQQNRIIMATSEAKCVELYGAKLINEVDDSMKPVAFFKVDVVAPPLRYRLEHAKQSMTNEVAEFCRYVSEQAALLEPNIPNMIGRCDSFAPDDDFFGTYDEERDRWEAAHHLGCINCFNGYVFDVDNLFREKKYMYRRRLNRTVYGALSQATEAQKGRRLYMVVTQTGPHQPGVTIIRAHPKFQFSCIDFFCHAKKLAMPKKILELQEGFVEKEASLKGVATQEAVKRDEAEQQVRRQAAADFFA
jgi:hypothetical protein